MEETDQRLEEGMGIAKTMWYTLAISIVNMAIEVYGLTKEQGEALKEVFLRPNEYGVRLAEI